ncbi:hypothetical protein SBP28_005321 [Candidozyma auris]
MNKLHFVRSRTPMESRSPSPAPSVFRNPEDSLARESDVTVSTNVTSYAEYKGFFIYVLSTLALLVYATWLLLPESYLALLGVYYYPSKYWAQAVPAYSLMLMLFIYIGLALYNTEVRTLPLDDPRSFTDEHAVYPDNPADYIHKTPSGVRDLPTPLVSEVLYM